MSGRNGILIWFRPNSHKWVHLHAVVIVSLENNFCRSANPGLNPKLFLHYYLGTSWVMTSEVSKWNFQLTGSIYTAYSNWQQNLTSPIFSPDPENPLSARIILWQALAQNLATLITLAIFYPGPHIYTRNQPMIWKIGILSVFGGTCFMKFFCGAMTETFDGNNSFIFNSTVCCNAVHDFGRAPRISTFSS